MGGSIIRLPDQIIKVTLLLPMTLQKSVHPHSVGLELTVSVLMLIKPSWGTCYQKRASKLPGSAAT